MRGVGWGEYRRGSKGSGVEERVNEVERGGNDKI